MPVNEAYAVLDLRLDIFRKRANTLHSRILVRLTKLVDILALQVTLAQSVCLLICFSKTLHQIHPESFPDSKFSSIALPIRPLCFNVTPSILSNTKETLRGK